MMGRQTKQALCLRDEIIIHCSSLTESNKRGRDRLGLGLSGRRVASEGLSEKGGRGEAVSAKALRYEGLTCPSNSLKTCEQVGRME